MAAKKQSSGERDSWSGDDSGHAQDFRIFFVGERGNRHASVFKKFNSAQQAIFAKFLERDLARKAFDGAQVDHLAFGFGIVRILVGIARDFGDGVERVLGLAVIAEHAIAAADLLQLAGSVGAIAGLAPHFLTLYKQGIPMIDAGIHRE